MTTQGGLTSLTQIVTGTRLAPSLTPKLLATPLAASEATVFLPAAALPFDPPLTVDPCGLIAEEDGCARQRKEMRGEKCTGGSQITHGSSGHTRHDHYC